MTMIDPVQHLTPPCPDFPYLNPDVSQFAMESSLSASRFNILRHTHILAGLQERRQDRLLGLEKTSIRS